MRCNDEDFLTIFCEIECILNNRPLTKLSGDPNDSAVLTTNHIYRSMLALHFHLEFSRVMIDI